MENVLTPQAYEEMTAIVPPPLPDAAPPDAPPPLPSDPPPMPELTVPRKRGSWRSLDWLPGAAVLLCLLVAVGMWYCGVFDGPPPASAHAMVSSSAAQRGWSTGMDLAKPRWPATFAAPLAGSGPGLSAGSLQPKTITGMISTYGNYADQKGRVSAIETQFPKLKIEVAAAQDTFDQRFRPSIETIDRLLVDWNPRRWASLRRKAGKPVDANHLTPDLAAEFLQELRSRAHGKLPADELDVLLAFNPDYATNPVREYLDGYTRDFHSNAKAREQGLEIRLKYPRSWMCENAAAAGALSTLRDRRCALNMVTVLVGDIPGGTVQSARQLDGMLALDDLRTVDPDVKLLDAGVGTLPSGRDALWREVRYTRGTRVGLFKLRGGDFTLPVGAHYVSIGFTVGARATVSDYELEAVYARYAPLFKQVLTDTRIVQ